ncbi:nuclear transport factor 2 family protein [Gordonia desulfuricans]|uniref:Nuclear transport factor 2 family protein n=1 Tax=Gordonia desulfuricans TaxID=89051 RepID=A0A7K3LIX5_9ACTN|nr:nuclear transport factor 2 family protein [Gordonia desulfuricans]NDK88170.1 nuclear transport factor 2 family protein [Gordonia desulfuricans]
MSVASTTVSVPVNDEKDVAAIKAVHLSWLDSNNDLVIEKMYPNFANPGYLQFNLNGHTYTSVDEKVKLWEGLHSIGFNLEDMKLVEEPVIHVEGNLGYLTTIWSALVSGTGSTGLMKVDEEPTVFRVTEVYRRDDGKGNPEWKIWHFHASPIAPPETPRFPQES